MPIRLAAILGFAAATLAAADPAMLRLLPPDAAVMAGMDAVRMKNSPFGQRLVGQTGADSASLDQLIRMTGFDPRRDVNEVLFATPSGVDLETLASPGGGSAAAGRVLFIARGQFDIARLGEAARSQSGFVESYHGVTVIGSKQDDESRMAFLSGSIALAGDAESVRAAIDRHRSGAAPDPALAARIQDVSTRYDFWFLTNESPALTLAPRVPNKTLSGAFRGDLFQAVRRMQIGVKAGALMEISVEAVTRSEKDAVALGDVIRFMSQVLEGNSGAHVSELLQKMDLRTEGATLRFSIAVPPAYVDQLFDPQSGRGRSRGVRVVQ